MRPISADLDRSRAEVTIAIELDPEADPLVLTYSTDRRGQGETAPGVPRGPETNQQYRQRIRDWLKTVRREARLMADHEAQRRGITPTQRDDVLADVAPAFE